MPAIQPPIAEAIKVPLATCAASWRSRSSATTIAGIAKISRKKSMEFSVQPPNEAQNVLRSSDVIAPYQAVGLSFAFIPASPAPRAYGGHSSIFVRGDDSPARHLSHGIFGGKKKSGPVMGPDSDDEYVLSRVGGEHAALGFGQEERRHDHETVSDQSEDSDRTAERHGGAQHAGEEWAQRSEAAAEIIGEALPRTAHAGRIQFRQNRPHARENPRDEKAEREAEYQHHRVVDVNLGVNEHGHDRADREQNEIRPPPNSIV